MIQGKNMIQSRQLHIFSNGEDTEEILAEAEKFAKEMNLSAKDTLRIRLLTEETMSMLRTMTGETEYTVGFTGNEKECVLTLETDTSMDVLKKDELLSVSSTGKNISTKGVMGKIRDVFEAAFTMPAGTEWSSYCPPAMMMGYPGEVDVYSARVMDSVYWSLNSYKTNVEMEGEPRMEMRDELEKSIVSNIADDVQVGVRGRHVVMNIIYAIKEK